MQRRVLTALSIASVLGTVAFAPASAQLVNGRWQAPPKPGGSAPRTGVAQSPAPRPAPAYSANVTSPIPIRVIHTITMSDGKIFADFGSGLEQVPRACPSSANGASLFVVGRAPAVTSARAQAQTPAAKSSCHLRDANGRIFATR